MSDASALESLTLALCEALGAAPAGAQAYALVDGALQRDAWRWLAERGGCFPIRLSRSVVSGTDVSVLPLLVTLPTTSIGPGSAQLRQTVRWALQHHAATWLISGLSPTSLREALTHRMQAKLPDNLPVLLRFADARVLPVLFTVLDARQRATFFSVADSWWYLDRRFELKCLRTREPIPAEGLTGPWIFDQAQEAAMLDAAEPDAVLRLLLTHDAQSLEKVPRAERHAFVVAQIDRSNKWSIDSTIDRALYCMIALAEGTQFDLQPHWRLALTRVSQKQTTLAQAVTDASSDEHAC